jgi:hypothetical protein
LVLAGVVAYKLPEHQDQILYLVLLHLLEVAEAPLKAFLLVLALPVVLEVEVMVAQPVAPVILLLLHHPKETMVAALALLRMAVVAVEDQAALVQCLAEQIMVALVDQVQIIQ